MHTSTCPACHTFKCLSVCTVCFSSTLPLQGQAESTYLCRKGECSSNPSAFAVILQISEESSLKKKKKYLLSELAFWISFLFDTKDRLLNFMVVLFCFLIFNFLFWSSCNIKLFFNERWVTKKLKIDTKKMTFVR